MEDNQLKMSRNLYSGFTQCTSYYISQPMLINISHVDIYVSKNYIWGNKSKINQLSSINDWIHIYHFKYYLINTDGKYQ